MAWRIVKQPNGLYARFSSIVDDFTHLNMTREEALELCQEVFAKYGEGSEEAKAKVDRADQFTERWASDVDLIRIIHGDKTAEERIAIDKKGR